MDSLVNFYNKMQLLTVLFLSACGYAEWPPKTYQLNDVNVPEIETKSHSPNSGIVVRSGESVYSISRFHKIPMRSIIEANKLTPPFILKVGQNLLLPNRGAVYSVKKGDTLFRIARYFNVDAYKVARINGIRPPYLIYVGQQITLIKSSSDKEKTSSITRSARKLKNSNISPKVKGSSPLKAASENLTAPFSKSGVKKVELKSTTSQRVPSPPPRSGLGFIWPVRGRIISRFGAKPKGLRNDGVNIKAGRGTPVLASENGVVAYAGNELRGFGKLLLVKHAGGWITAYAHNERLLVQRGQKLRRGQKIATVGSTGNVSIPQLHFEIRFGKSAKNPRNYIKNRMSLLKAIVLQT